MDEALDVVEVVAESGFEDAFAWVLRALGILLVLAGLGVWLLTELIWLPVALVAAGLICLVAPQILLFLVELAG
ncbi:DUF4175 domain-containing protein [Halorubellus sp. JP-L1]|uniref:DUF4175 domain-containing protein n=1 Tax=Halorubellus sp. JP-L1 TaxID=2715753 RepID=UPI00140A1707|nr:DUF4175 domain-containing protein [Halorubellus sp. JP-L1]NHN40219.1 DUF4175 domain-containing protein [Halorubellus sp. JP-L1]